MRRKGVRFESVETFRRWRCHTQTGERLDLSSTAPLAGHTLSFIRSVGRATNAKHTASAFEFTVLLVLPVVPVPLAEIKTRSTHNNLKRNEGTIHKTSRTSQTSRDLNRFAGTKYLTPSSQSSQSNNRKKRLLINFADFAYFA